MTSQYADLVAYNGTLLKARNIIGAYQPENKKRIALFAHWDSRPCLRHESLSYTLVSEEHQLVRIKPVLWSVALFGSIAQELS